MDRDLYRLEVLRMLIVALGRDFVTEDLIRDTKKIADELFDNLATEE